MPSNDELGRLLGLVSHELRGPLGVLRGYLRMLDQDSGALTAQQRLAVSAALRATDRCADVATQVGSLARLRRGDTTFQLQPTGLDTIVGRIAGLVPLPTDPAITLTVAPSPDVQVRADPAALTNALASLALAVVRAQSRAQTVQVSSGRNGHDPNTGVEIAMRLPDLDNGVVPRPLDVGRGGAGMELAIAESIVQAHAGRITEWRRGSTLVGMLVWLPNVD